MKDQALFWSGSRVCTGCKRFFGCVPLTPVEDIGVFCAECFEKHLKQREELLNQARAVRAMRVSERRQRERVAALAPQRRFYSAKRSAIARGKQWNLTIEQYEALISLPCEYCRRQTENTGIGLDRKDNRYGYYLDNVVPCCGACNATRGDRFSYDEFRHFIAPGIRELCRVHAAASSS